MMAKKALSQRRAEQQLRKDLSIGQRVGYQVRKRWHQRWLYLLVLPAMVSTFLFGYLPLWGVTLAFRNWSAALGFASPWAKPIYYNFWFLRDPEFWNVMVNTIRISAVKFVFLFPAPIALALLINEITHSAYKRVVQTITYLPHFVSWVIMAGIIYRILDSEPSSPLNLLRGLFGMEPIAILGDEGFFIPLLVVSALIKEVGWGTIIYLAAIMAIDVQLYEAAIVDGAGKLAQTWHITLPGILPTVSILLILSLPALLTAGFDQIYNLMNPSVAKIANVSDIYVLRIGIIQGKYSYGTALGLIFGMLSLGLTITANKLARRSVGYGLW